jgi:hypothetical protein
MKNSVCRSSNNSDDDERVQKRLASENIPWFQVELEESLHILRHFVALFDFI